MAPATAARAAQAAAAAGPLKIVALGDSLTAGFGLPEDKAFPAKLQTVLRGKGYDVTVINAGASGDTASGGLARLDWSVPEGTDAVILELGANDALRGIDPKVTEAALDQILTRLAQRHIPVLFTGMLSPRNMGDDYERAYNAIFPALAAKHDVIFYPFFLKGVWVGTTLSQSDMIHPNIAGVGVIVINILPSVEELIARAQKARGQ
jgi:acyl-CoA thioesterase-1